MYRSEVSPNDYKVSYLLMNVPCNHLTRRGVLMRGGGGDPILILRNANVACLCSILFVFLMSHVKSLENL